MKKILTKSRLSCARRCKRRHQFEYELGYRPVEDEENQRFGTIVHGALEPWYLAWMRGAPQDEWLGFAMEALAKVTDPFVRAQAEVMMTAYHLRWKDEPYEILGVEEEFRVPLRNPKTGALSRTWDLGGKLDVRLRDRRTAKLHFMEHKTSGEDITNGSKYWRRLRMDTQVTVYFEGCLSLGEPADTCIYDILGKPGQRPSNVPLLDENGEKIVLNAASERVRTKDGKKWRQTGDTEAGYTLQTRLETPEEYRARLVEVVAENPEKYLVRGEVVRLENEMAGGMSDVWMTGQEIREAELEDRWPKNPDACEQVGLGTCPFWGVCAGEVSIDNTGLFRRSANVHPELSTQDAQEGNAA